MSAIVCVTEEDIAHGVRNSFYGCPVALALNRATGRRWWADLEFLEPDNNFAERVLTPAHVRAFMNRFDLPRQSRRQPWRPFRFVLPRPKRKKQVPVPDFASLLEDLTAVDAWLNDCDVEVLSQDDLATLDSIRGKAYGLKLTIEAVITESEQA